MKRLLRWLVPAGFRGQVAAILIVGVVLSQVLAGVRESMDRLTSEIARLQTDRTPDRATSTMASGQPPASKPPPRPGH